jgi:ABC-type long-subunit fatty acid transport system fused permease/ATPase subunit
MPASIVKRTSGCPSSYNWLRSLRVRPHTGSWRIPLPSGMPLINVVLTLVVVGVILWLINTYIPMQGTIKNILNIVVVIVVVLWLLYGFGIINGSGNVHMPVVK